MPSRSPIAVRYFPEASKPQIEGIYDCNYYGPEGVLICIVKDVPVDINLLTSLTELDLGRNEITILPAEVGKLTNLTMLNLMENKLTQVINLKIFTFNFECIIDNE